MLENTTERTEPQALCRAEELEERGSAVGFDVLLWRQPARGFALRFDGRVVAYLNRCAHVPTEMDWQPGEFLDADKRHIVCSIHGATYEPASGRCLGGPCDRGRLMAIEVGERDGQVYWYPSRDVRPLTFDDEGGGAAELPSATP
jgi:nitrite reductase/ring-hydroxylating ferredoxin subunit